MRATKLLYTLAALAGLIGLVAIPATAAPPTQGGNLLQNPNFDGGTQGWSTWSYFSKVMQEDKKTPDLDKSFETPNFGPSEPNWDKSGTEGSAGMVSGVHYWKFRAGFYQSVDVPAGARVRFSVWVNGLCVDDNNNNNPVLLRAGINPNGGTTWDSSNIQWVDVQVGNTKYAQLATPEVTVGPNGRVTVFTWGEPQYPVIYNAAYFDNASLVVTAGAPATTPTGAPPTAKPAAPAAQAPCAQLRYVSDVTIPDGAPVAPGAQFVKTWRVKNAGTCAFSGSLNFIGSGNPMGGSPTNFPKIEVGQTADVTINLTAPAQPGSYQGTWQARASDGTALENLTVKITVTGEAATPVPAVTATPQGPPASPTPTTGQVCILAYNDRNGDAQQDADESLLPGVVFALSDTSGPKESYTTDGVSEPHCFLNLPAGSYQITIKPPTNYSATTQKVWTIALNGGMKTDVPFGARRGGAAPTPTSTSGGGNSGIAGLLGSAGRIVLIVVAILVLLGLGFVGGFVLLGRR
jgi:hypothetical protein